MMTQDVSVKKTTINDFERIYPLLLMFNSPYSREDWKRIFNYKWDGAQDHIGYHLEKGGGIVGFMGLVFSCRYRNNHRYAFCNMTSLIVKSEYRAFTFLLLRKITSYPDTIFTGLGPIPESYNLHRAQGFVPFENYYKILPVINSLFCSKKNLFIDESKNLLNKLDAENKRIAIDHMNLRCKSILFGDKEEVCLFIFNTSKQKHYGLSVTKIHLHYISNITFFNKKIRAILGFFRTKFGFFSAVYVDKRFFLKSSWILLFSKGIEPAKIRTKNYIDEIDVDALYSEKVLLG